MKEETKKGALSAVVVILVCFVLMALVHGIKQAHGHGGGADTTEVSSVKVRTELRIDTLYLSAPMAPLFVVNIPTPSTHDTIYINTPTALVRQSAYFEEEGKYQLWASGFLVERMRVDSLRVFSPTVTHYVDKEIIRTITRRPRWSVGPYVGLGYPGGLQVGVGVQYSLFSF